jgi:hypothetical protein
MFNQNTTSYSEDRRNLYIAMGFAGMSLISYSEVTNPIMEKTTQTSYVEVEKVELDDSTELTQHAMNLAQASLAEDWDDENDEHWESFL